jgi:hypothetical protein
MPGGDRTGPMGRGPKTGRAAGRCAGSEMPEYANRLSGRGVGMGFGRGIGLRGGGFGGGGRGWRNMFCATGLPGWMRSGGHAAPSQKLDAETEKQLLANQAETLQSELDSINKRLGEIETRASK